MNCMYEVILQLLIAPVHQVVPHLLVLLGVPWAKGNY